MTFRTCECGANLDPNEPCRDCKEAKEKAASGTANTEGGEADTKANLLRGDCITD